MQPTRNARIVGAFYLLLAVAAIAVAGLAAMMAMYECFVKKPSFFSILGGAQWGFAAWCLWLMGLRMFRAGMRTGSRILTARPGSNARH
jgi:hypothetical protein